MSVLVRKISFAKWKPSNRFDKDEIRADAVTADLRTQQDTLSFWRCDAVDNASIDRVVLALAVGLNHADKIDVAWIPMSAVDKQGVAHQDTPGRTAIESLRNRHVDLILLDLNRLGHVAKLISSAVRGQHCRRVRKPQVIQIVAQAVRDGQVAMHQLEDKMRQAVRRVLPSEG